MIFEVNKSEKKYFKDDPEADRLRSESGRKRSPVSCVKRIGTDTNENSEKSGIDQKRALRPL